MSLCVGWGVFKVLGLIALFLPLVFGGVLAYPLGRRANSLGKRVSLDRSSAKKLFIRMLGETSAVILSLAMLLAILFADLVDTLDGEASLGQFIGYAKLQAILLSILPVPTALFGFRDGKGERQ